MRFLFSFLAAGALMLPVTTHAQTVQAIIAEVNRFLNDTVIATLFAVAILAFMVNVVRYFMIESTNETGREKAKRFILYSILAFVILFSLWGIVRIFVNALGVGSESATGTTVTICPDFLGSYCSGGDVLTTDSFGSGSGTGSNQSIPATIGSINNTTSPSGRAETCYDMWGMPILCAEASDNGGDTCYDMWGMPILCAEASDADGDTCYDMWGMPILCADAIDGGGDTCYNAFGDVILCDTCTPGDGTVTCEPPCTNNLVTWMGAPGDYELCPGWLVHEDKEPTDIRECYDFAGEIIDCGSDAAVWRLTVDGSAFIPEGETVPDDQTCGRAPSTVPVGTLYCYNEEPRPEGVGTRYCLGPCETDPLATPERNYSSLFPYVFGDDREQFILQGDGDATPNLTTRSCTSEYDRYLDIAQSQNRSDSFMVLQNSSGETDSMNVTTRSSDGSKIRESSLISVDRPLVNRLLNQGSNHILVHTHPAQANDVAFPDDTIRSRGPTPIDFDANCRLDTNAKNLQTVVFDEQGAWLYQARNANCDGTSGLWQNNNTDQHLAMIAEILSEVDTRPNREFIVTDLIDRSLQGNAETVATRFANRNLNQTRFINRLTALAEDTSDYSTSALRSYAENLWQDRTNTRTRISRSEFCTLIED